MKSFEKLKTAHEIKHLVTSKFSQLLSFQFKAIGYTNSRSERNFILNAASVNKIFIFKY